MYYTLVIGWLIASQPQPLETRVCHYVPETGDVVEDRTELLFDAHEAIDAIGLHHKQGAPIAYIRADFGPCEWAAWY